ncbi:hypothetical protein TNIN_202211 [Trichonephila inaurata madagascariensis]|uniref:Uncharacterized protein n=1 Tax=Trichonephila inaurata madagascariensis TaxID=2747483 RepID=A0A8X7C4E3_9ARAC|nr:hypothetical protein TNIN_202211 [Trichonephila inaurata madagascariensis]
MVSLYSYPLYLEKKSRGEQKEKGKKICGSQRNNSPLIPPITAQNWSTGSSKVVAQFGSKSFAVQKSACSHQSIYLVDNFLERETIKLILGPLKSPDLNRIEDLRNYLENAVARRYPPPKDVNDMKNHIAIRVEFNSAE